MVARHLRSIGYKVVEAVDGDEALALALEHLPDLVVLDVMMPGMSGWEVCRRIRETVSLAHTGVVMLTGIGESLNEITSPLYGADAHLDKPFEFAVLDRTIAQTIESRRDHVGRPDGADVEIVQTTDEADESSQPPPTKLKRARLTGESNTDEEDSFLKSLGKRAARRKAAEASSDMNDGSSAHRVEFNFLDGPTKPAKKRESKAYPSTQPAPSEGSTKSPAVTKSRRKSKAATDVEPSDERANGDLLELSPVSTKKKKLAKAKKSKPSSSKKKPAKKAASKKPVTPRSAKVSKVAKKAGKKKAGKKAAKGKKRTSAPKKSAKRRVIAKKAVGKASAKARANSVKTKAAAARKKSKPKAKAAKKTSRVKPAAKKQLVKKAPAKAAKKSSKSKGKKKARR
jgi:CheY-like chemotaxis protein